ncbi:MAG: DUF4450 domain-containing protein, partial [Tannerella sp.]|nr:DUF4450 domain-containing protein [Tannerella sp.]
GHGPSTDGVDIDSSAHILIENCDIDCNDDNFCLKSGRDADGLRVNRPTEYIVIRNCISRAGGGLITCGSETSGGIRYVLADGLKAIGTTVGIRLKSAMNRGGTTEYIYIKNVEMDDVGTVFEATMNWNPAYSYSVLPKEYEGKAIPEHWKKMLEEVKPSQGMPFFNQVHLSGLKVKHAKTFLNVAGSKESMMAHFQFENIDADVEKIGKISYARDWKLSELNIKPKDKRPVQINNCQGIHFPDNNQLQAVTFPYKLHTSNPAADIRAAKHPEFAFLFPEIAGNLKFGLVNGKANKWLSEMRIKDMKHDANRLVYTLSDPMLQNGELVLEVLSLSDTDGVIIAVRGENIPDRLQLCYSYGGAGGEVLPDPKVSGLQPFLCKDNVFSIEQTAFTLYYGTSMELKTVQGILPVHAEIRLANSCSQNSPVAFFKSGKKTDFPALAAMISLKNNTEEYFCIYRQNKNADYNHFMLAELFAKEKK